MLFDGPNDNQDNCPLIFLRIEKKLTVFSKLLSFHSLIQPVSNIAELILNSVQKKPWVS